MIDAKKILPWMGQYDRSRFESPFVTDPAAPGWVSNGHFMVFVGEKAAKPFTGGWKRKLAALIAEVTKDSAEGPVLSEKVSMRKPSDLGSLVICKRCPGDRCVRCGGEGIMGQREAGQRVWTREIGAAVYTDFDYGGFLDGLDVRLAGVASTSPLVGREQDGRVVAVVMPIDMGKHA